MLITFEGLDFSGKSTQATLLVKTLEQRGNQVLFLREPGGTAISEKVRDLLLDNSHQEMTKTAELFLFSAARSQLVSEVIKPALREGKVVVCDRFFDSTTAYQGYGRGLDLTGIQAINRMATDGTTPDITMFIDVEIDELINRQKLSGVAADRMESSGRIFYERVRSGYRSIIEQYPQRVLLIDGSQTREMIQEKIWKLISSRLPSSRINN